MNTLIHFGLLIFIIYLPILIFILGYLAPKKYPGFSFTTHWISNLGQQLMASRPYFNFSLRLLVLLALPLFYCLYSRLPKHPLSWLFLISLFFTGVLIFLVTFFPMDKHFKIHLRIANWLFLSLFIALLSCLLVFTRLISSFTIIITTILGLTTVAFLSVSGYLLSIHYPSNKIIGNLKSIRLQEQSFIIRNNTILEWLFFYSE